MTPVETYRWGRARLVQLVDGADVDVAVAACPGWQVRDVVAHVTGIAADFLSGRLPAGDLDAWTAEQVAVRRPLPFSEVLAEWERRAPQFEMAMAGPLAGGASRFAADVVSHGLDVAGALGVKSGRSGPAVEAALQTFVSMLDARLGGDSRVVVTTGSSALAAGSGGPEAALVADPFEALRVLSGRRTEAEIRQLDWRGDLERVIDRLSPYPRPARSLGE